MQRRSSVTTRGLSHLFSTAKKLKACNVIGGPFGNHSHDHSAEDKIAGHIVNLYVSYDKKKSDKANLLKKMQDKLKEELEEATGENADQKDEQPKKISLADLKKINTVKCTQ